MLDRFIGKVLEIYFTTEDGVDSGEYYYLADVEFPFVVLYNIGDSYYTDTILPPAGATLVYVNQVIIGAFTEVLPKDPSEEPTQPSIQFSPNLDVSNLMVENIRRSVEEMMRVYPGAHPLTNRLWVDESSSGTDRYRELTVSNPNRNEEWPPF